MKKEPGKYYKNAQSYKWFVRPKQKKMSMPEYISVMNRLYANNDEATPERFNDKIQKQGKYEVKPKKKIKKVADSSLVSPQGPLPYNFDKWLDTIDPQWWLPEDYEAVKDPVEEARLRHLKLKQMEEARLDSEGIRTLLKPKRLT